MDSFVNLFVIKEAVNSVAIEHGACDCTTCRAAEGDAEALAEVYAAVRKARSE